MHRRCLRDFHCFFNNSLSSPFLRVTFRRELSLDKSLSLQIPEEPNFSYYSIVSYRIGVKWSLHALTQNVDYKAFPSENNFAVTTVTLSHHLTYYVTVGLHEMLNVTAKRI